MEPTKTVTINRIAYVCQPKTVRSFEGDVSVRWVQACAASPADAEKAARLFVEVIRAQADRKYTAAARASAALTAIELEPRPSQWRAALDLANS